MKKAALITIVFLLAQAPALAHGKEQAYNVLLAGGSQSNMITIWLTSDGQSYVIDSVVPLEVGGEICQNPAGNPNELICQASMVGSFEVNAGAGDDVVTTAKGISIPVIMRAGSGNDALSGGAGPDKLIGGTGDDRLIGRSGADLIYGGDGADQIYGGWGNDVLSGGAGEDSIFDRHGPNRLLE
jgi:Ca2+-binding RTX toxin-like protein